ncbi:Hypothetical predicted protein [Mytilus galloprovincialis]|nr:Hypothetical predicted protein [Mytilus galloprovincialis]
MSGWIHSRNGKFIRELNTDFIDEETNILHFPFCDHGDSGEYICMLTTDYSSLPSINISTHLLVNGPPIVLNQQTEDDGDDLILSVMFYSIPYKFDIQWFLGNISLNGDPQYTITVKNTTVELKQYNVDVATEGFISNLTIHNFKGLASAVYNCKMSNTYGVVVEEVVSRPVNIDLQRLTYCNTSGSINLKCTLHLVGAISVPWIHSNAGETIRSLEGRYINNSNILTIFFCNSQDTGDYTCRWKTDISGQALLEKTSTLSVSGPPFITSHSQSVDKFDTVLSVSFFSQPFPNDPQWQYNNEPVALGSKFLQTTTYSIVQIKQHRVIVNEEGFMSNLTVHNADFGLYKCIVQNKFGQVHHLFTFEQEQNELSTSTTEATTDTTTSQNSPGESIQLTVIIAISSAVFGIVTVGVCIIFFIKRISPKKSASYNNTIPTRNEDKSYNTIDMTTLSNITDNEGDYVEVY